MSTVFQRIPLAVLFLGISLTSCTSEEICWQDRVLPLPREMEVEGHAKIRAGNIRYAIRTREDAPPYSTVRFLLDAFARGENESAEYTIELVLANERPHAVPREIRARLKTLPNASQAYALFIPEDHPKVLRIAANTPVGLLYGAHTVRQLVWPGRWAETADPETWLAVPRVRIVDWPAVRFRGSREAAAYNSLGWNSQWKLNCHALRLTTWRGDNVPFGTARKEVRRLANIDSDLFRAWVKWAREIGTTYSTTIEHLGHMAATGLAGISPAVYTKEHPAPANPKARGFCWARGQEIYTVLEEEMRKAAGIAARFPEEERIIGVLLTEHTGTSCYCPECGGESGYILETKAILGIFEKLKAEDPALKLTLTLSQGSRPINDRILEILSGVPDAGIEYYDGRYTYRNERIPMIPEIVGTFSRNGGFVNVVMTLMPARWDTQTPGNLPHYVRGKAREFAEKKIQSATHFDMVGAQFYWPLTMAAWGEYLWNPRGRSVSDFARAYATITGTAEPDLFARWAEKAGQAAYELGVSQYMRQMGRARYGLLPEVVDEGTFQEILTIRLDKALRDAQEALMLARMADVDVMRWESEFTLAALQSLAIRLELEDKMASETPREDGARLLRQFDECARVAAAAAYAWHERAMEEREALAAAPGFLRPPEWTRQLPYNRDLERTVPYRRQWLAWHGLLHAGDMVAMMASLAGIPDSRGEFAPVEIADWESDEYEKGRLIKEWDITDDLDPAGGRYLLEFQILDGPGNTLRVQLAGVREPTGEKREISSTGLWNMRNPANPDESIQDLLLVIPERRADERWKLKVRFTSTKSRAGSTGVVSLRRIWSREEVPEDRIDQWLEE